MKKKNKKRGWRALFFTKGDELDLAILFSLLLLVAGLVGVFVECFTHYKLSVAGWAFIGGSFSSTLIGSIPVNRARILANATLPASVTKALTDLGNPLGSSDLEDGLTR